MVEHILYGKTPCCPNCGKKQDAALGGKSAPKNNSICICAYCASINIFEVVGSVYKLHIATATELSQMNDEGVLEKVYAIQDFIKLKIEARK